MTDFFLRGEGLFLPPEILVRHRDTVHSPGGSVRRDVAVLSPMLGVHALGNGTLSAPWQTVHWSRGDDSPPRLRLEFKPPEDSLPPQHRSGGRSAVYYESLQPSRLACGPLRPPPASLRRVAVIIMM